MSKCLKVGREVVNVNGSANARFFFNLLIYGKFASDLGPGGGGGEKNL